MSRSWCYKSSGHICKPIGIVTSPHADVKSDDIIEATINGLNRFGPFSNRPLLTACDSNLGVFAADFEREILKSSSLKFSCFREKWRLGGNMGVDGSDPDFKTSRYDWYGGEGKRGNLSVESRVGGASPPEKANRPKTLERVF
ncbi:MAG: hypothetical protein ACPL7O_05175 [Armatimonadota bacterium]